MGCYSSKVADKQNEEIAHNMATFMADIMENANWQDGATRPTKSQIYDYLLNEYRADQKRIL